MYLDEGNGERNGNISADYLSKNETVEIRGKLSKLA